MGAAGHRYKVARVLDRYGIPEFGDELVRRWTAEGEERQSLRELASLTNERLLASAMSMAGADPLDGEAANRYRLLVDDEVSEGVRTQGRRRLVREGVDVERLEQDFVSYQAVRTYLTEGRGVEPGGPAEDPVERATEHVRRLSNRVTAVTDDRIDRLRDAGAIEAGETRVLLDLRVSCEDCGRHYDAMEFLEAGGCGCGNP